jgi:hypothetical protein
MTNFDLCSVIPGAPEKQNGVGDNRACQLLKEIWNEKYPDYPIRIHWNNHEFGNYPDLVTSESNWERGLQNGLDIETEILEFADKWNENIGNITAEIWQKYEWINPVPFKLEY